MADQKDLFGAPLTRKAAAALRRKLHAEARRIERERIIAARHADAQELFRAWQELFDKQESRFTKDRQWHTSKMLEIFPKAKLLEVLQIAARDPNTRGDNRLHRPFDDMVNIFRNEERVEMYLSMGRLQDRRAPNLTPKNTPSQSERF